jgi:hypothetical protein
MEYMEMLGRWRELQVSIRHLQDEEKQLREQLFEGTFPDPVEGSNKYELPDGSVLKGTYKLNRKFVKGFTPQDLKVSTELRNMLVSIKYDLSVAAYKKLDEQTRKKVDSVLEIKPGLPSLELIPPQ